ncbi:unnamed protein product [Clavelina lepadiformis]|uniref:RNA helicase n=1 Tax=Clavelina lepadiformis TaxID=159417 RepID=A0ABP0G6E9_CLALP
MSGYFVHGGTQYPFGQSTSQQSTSGTQSYYGGSSYQNSQSQSVGQGTQYAAYDASPAPSGSYSSNYPSQYSNNGTYTTPSNEAGYGAGPNYQNSSGGGYSTASGSKSGTYSYTNTGNSYSHSSYEKALYNAANQYYSNNRGQGAGKGRGSAGRGRGRGGRNVTQNTQTPGGPKPIKATEIKAYLYAWCGQRKLKPQYEVTTEGQPPKKVLFGCKLVITGLDYVAQVEASNKKDAQSKAAWDFCENLVKTGYMKASELPPKPDEPTPKTTTGETSRQVGSLPPETSETIDKYGGWTLTNSRQRLNQFCQREHSSPVFKHETLGPEHARIFICDLTLNINALQKEFTASERGSNKKQATAICALSMVRQLYEANLIEKFGDPIKHVTRGVLLSGQKPKDGSGAMAVTAGQKRKAEDQPSMEAIDENGNWTVDNSRQRLNQFCQHHNISCDVMYEEEGTPSSKTYTASLELNVKANEEEKHLKARSSGQSKKVAAQGCALQLLAQLYKLTLVEANFSGGQPNKKKQSRARDDLQPLLEPGFHFGPSGFNPGPPVPFGRQPIMRRTPTQDYYLQEKHKTIYPSESELDMVQRTVRAVELALKDVSEAMYEDEEVTVKEEPEVEKSPFLTTTESDPSMKRKLQGVMRVGTLAKGLLLRGDLSVGLVLLCQEAPTAKLLVGVAQLLPKKIVPIEGDSYNVETAMQSAALVITNTTVEKEDEPALVCSITVSLTSPVVRNPVEEGKKDPRGSLNKEKCLNALALLRHAKWFQACANGIPSCVVIIRILRDMSRMLKPWKALTDWAIELLTEKSLCTSPVPLTLGGSFMRVLEVISSGILLPGGPGLADPCERTETDVTANMTNQEREDLTAAAQSALRLFVFRRPELVLGMDLSKRNDPSSNKKQP